MSLRTRFLRESEVAAAIEHPHVVPVLRVGEEDGLLFIAMRFISGSDLGAMIAANDLPRPLAFNRKRMPPSLGTSDGLGVATRSISSRRAL